MERIEYVDLDDEKITAGVNEHPEYGRFLSITIAPARRDDAEREVWIPAADVESFLLDVARVGCVVIGEEVASDPS